MQVCTLVTMDICGSSSSKVRSYYSANNVTDMALYTEAEEIYLMKVSISGEDCQRCLTMICIEEWDCGAV